MFELPGGYTAIVGSRGVSITSENGGEAVVGTLEEAFAWARARVAESEARRAANVAAAADAAAKRPAVLTTAAQVGPDSWYYGLNDRTGQWERLWLLAQSGSDEGALPQYTYYFESERPSSAVPHLYGPDKTTLVDRAIPMLALGFATAGFGKGLSEVFGAGGSFGAGGGGDSLFLGEEIALEFPAVEVPAEAAAGNLATVADIPVSLADAPIFVEEVALEFPAVEVPAESVAVPIQEAPIFMEEIPLDYPAVDVPQATPAEGAVASASSIPKIPSWLSTAASGVKTAQSLLQKKAASKSGAKSSAVLQPQSPTYYTLPPGDVWSKLKPYAPLLGALAMSLLLG